MLRGAVVGGGSGLVVTRLWEGTKVLDGITGSCPGGGTMLDLCRCSAILTQW